MKMFGSLDKFFYRNLAGILRAWRTRTEWRQGRG
jgi:hypothetical protein